MDGSKETLSTRPAFAQPQADLKSSRRLPLMILGPLVVLAGAAYIYLTGGRYESTGDAYVQQAHVDISANVAGRVTELAVRDNQLVKKGDLLFRLALAIIGIRTG